MNIERFLGNHNLQPNEFRLEHKTSFSSGEVQSTVGKDSKIHSPDLPQQDYQAEIQEIPVPSKLTIVIVNFNTKDFLRDCLSSISRNKDEVRTDIYIVDNASRDESATMVRTEFPDVQLIENRENVGFSRANNQALKKITSEYILILNPDTIIHLGTLPGITDFMDKHPEVAVTTAKLIRPNGELDLGCRRTFPTTEKVVYEMLGLSKKFPNSKRFGSYFMTYLDEDQEGEVEAVSGAFMFIRRKVLDQVGFFDEDFFLLGEDLDLAYRIYNAVNPETGENWKIYYNPSFTVTHYSGRSRSQVRLRSGFESYRSTRMFYKKHYAQQHNPFINLLTEGGLLAFGATKILRAILPKKS